MVPKTQHLVSLLSEKITSRLCHFGSVLLSVKLDYQSMFETVEIGNKRTNFERGSQTRPLGSAALRLVSDIDAGTSRRTPAAQAVATKENAPLPFAPTAAVVRAREVWMAYHEGQLYQHPRIFMLLPSRFRIRRARRAHVACAIPRAAYFKRRAPLSHVERAPCP